MQPVVVSREKAKTDFANRLNEALDDVEGCPKRLERGRAAWVAKRYGVSGEGASKWLDGRVIPDQTNIARIAADLNITPQWLQAGQLPKRPPAQDPAIETFGDLWRELDDDERAEVLSFIRFKASRGRTRPPNP